jgi:hypothetical protein
VLGGGGVGLFNFTLQHAHETPKIPHLLHSHADYVQNAAFGNGDVHMILSGAIVQVLAGNADLSNCKMP